MIKFVAPLDYEGIKLALTNNPQLANEGIALGAQNPSKAHPLHRICDGVFAGLYSEAEAVEIAKLFLAHGADVNGGELKELQDTPLIAAASLHADQVALLYLDAGAFVNHAGCEGGTALHWAAWCGRAGVVKRLIQENAGINKKCVSYKATPLFWAVHGLKHGAGENVYQQVECVKMLLAAGADKSIPNGEGDLAVDMLGEADVELKALLG